MVFAQTTMKLHVAIMVEVEADKVHTQSGYKLPFLHAHLYVESGKDNNRCVMVVNYARAIILEKSEMSYCTGYHEMVELGVAADTHYFDGCRNCDDDCGCHYHVQRTLYYGIRHVHYSHLIHGLSVFHQHIPHGHNHCSPCSNFLGEVDRYSVQVEKDTHSLVLLSLGYRFPMKMMDGLSEHQLQPDL